MSEQTDNTKGELEETQEVKASFFARHKQRKAEKKQTRLNQIEEQIATEEEKTEVKEKLKEADEEVKSANSTKKKIKNAVFFAFNIVIVVAILLYNLLGTDDSITSFLSLRINGWAFLIYLLLVIGIIMVDVMSVHRMIYRKTLRSRWALSYKSSATMRYYDAITPLASGGQAFMATYLTSRDVPGSVSLSIPIAKLLFQQIDWIIICSCCLISATVMGISTGFVSATSIIGYVLAFSMVLIILFLSLFKKFGQKIIAWLLNILRKLHLLKDYEKRYQSIMTFVEDYQDIMREYSKSFGEILYQMFLHAFKYIFTYSIPFLIYCIFKGFPTTGAWALYSEYFIYAALIDLSSSFIPLPGGTGMNEITFTVLFSTVLGGETFWALLLWRFCTYYMYLVQGIFLLAYDTFYGNKKYRWVKKRLELQEESKDFRKLQIDNFRLERDKRRKKDGAKAVK